MDRPQSIAIDQALFGYSDGHRQLASSVRLSARDMYELASRSDLVPGARLEPSDTYITGFSLPESRMFAFMKTWLAPEMPRPGCVWSHVLLLPKNFLTAQIDLGILATFLTRPEVPLDRQFYSSKLSVRRLARGAPADPSLVERVLLAYYTSREILLETPPTNDFDRAVLAVWSQQWPKLRTEFEFRTFLTSAVALDKGLKIRVGPAGAHVSDEPSDKNWLKLAVEDAVATEVTPLRRFLWRYGKDVTKPRRAFIDLVNLYGDSLRMDHGLTAKQVSWVFRKLPGKGNASTLKRDLLGMSSPALALIPRIRAQDFVEIVSQLKPIQDGLATDHELAGATSSYGVAEIPAFALALAKYAPERSNELDLIERTIIQDASVEVLSNPALPTSFVLQVLRTRPVLINKFNLELLSVANVAELLPLVDNTAIRRRLIKRVFSDKPTRQAAQVIAQLNGLSLGAAVDSSKAGALSRRWREFLPGIANELLGNGLEMLDGVRSVSHAIQLLDYPVNTSVPASEWFQSAKRSGDAGSQADRQVVDTFILVLSIREGVNTNISLVSDVLPRVRASVIVNELPDRLSSLLDRFLPDISDRWDLNKRLLKVLRHATRDGVDVTPILQHLSLSDEEFAYSMNVTSKDGSEFNFTKLFWPW
ncbi:GAP1-N1 domain-containing protein [Microvirga puerhi]|uniref:Uncharacterized protein n=1 Tax=Microvirga puerhi TaxID=2876078 RepID=A0ABS7VPT8_9HYPH|nr:hypothetical protein [Microvirga puerhi]MBZ6077578.1 hypothetical protein [Microvirga puerhi]